MSTQTKAKKKPQRKAAKRYEIVRFTLDFIDGEIELPTFKQVPTKVQRKTLKGDPDYLVEFLETYGGEGVADLFDDLDDDEVELFMSAWANASGVDLGK